MPETVNSLSQVDQLRYSTTRIEADLPSGTSIGTGFFVGFTPDPHNPDRVFPALVTNRHVVEGAAGGRVLLHEAQVRLDGVRQPSALRLYAEVADFSQAWIMHPNSHVDLAGAPLGRIIHDFERSGRPLFLAHIGENLIPSPEHLQRLSVMEDVVMVGYPAGLADEAHGLPLFRHGYTASHPAVDFDDRPLGALDIALVPGSSGSPVMTYRPSLDNPGARHQSHQAVLLGVLFGGPQVTLDGTFHIAPLPTVASPNVMTRTFMNVGYYVKARELLPLKEEMLRTLGIPGG